MVLEYSGIMMGFMMRVILFRGSCMGLDRWVFRMGISILESFGWESSVGLDFLGKMGIMDGFLGSLERGSVCRLRGRGKDRFRKMIWLGCDVDFIKRCVSIVIYSN